MSAYDLKGKIAIVTGAGSGINHALTELLLESGCSVVMADLRLRPEAQETLDKYAHQPGKGNSDGGPSAVFQPTDMSNWAQIRALWEAALQKYGRVDVVVNGAGVYEPPTSNFWNPPLGGGDSAPSSSDAATTTATAPEDDADAAVGQYKTFAVNATGPIRLAQIAVEYWLRHRGEVEGNLLWFASLAGYVHSLLTPLYYASKAAVISTAKSLGGLREHCGIKSACICPGLVHSPLIDEVQKHLPIRPDDIALTSKECAEVAMRLLQEPQYGDGNIIECLKVVYDSSGEASVEVREVPLEKLYPSLEGRDLGHNQRLAESEAKFIGKLKENGMRGLVE